MPPTHVSGRTAVTGLIASLLLLAGVLTGCGADQPTAADTGGRREPIPPDSTTTTTLVPPVACEGPTWHLASDVLFALDSAELHPDARAALEICAAKVLTHLDNGGQRVEIHGFTDGLASYAYNEELSQRRADAVKSALLQGLHLLRPEAQLADRLVTFAHGEEGAPNDIASPPHRRVEVRLK